MALYELPEQPTSRYVRSFGTGSAPNNANAMTDKIRTMSLREPNLRKIQSGVKTVEIRVRYPNYKDLAVGQLLQFLSGDDQCLTRIVKLNDYPSFEAMLENEDPLAIGYEAEITRDQMLERVRAIYPPKKEALGVLAIHIEQVAGQG